MIYVSTNAPLKSDQIGFSNITAAIKNFFSGGEGFDLYVVN